MTELTKGLRGQLLNCECYARSQGECGCGATWPEDYCAEAADEIERQRAVIADFEQTPCWREYREENKKLTEERDELVADAKRWRYWRSLLRQQLAECEREFREYKSAVTAQIEEARANDRCAMAYLSQIREAVGGDDFPDMVKRVLALIGERDAGRANARRIVACVNACDGIPTDDLEACPHGGMFYLADHTNQLVMQRDELLTLIKAHVNASNNDDTAGDTFAALVRVSKGEA